MPTREDLPLWADETNLHHAILALLLLSGVRRLLAGGLEDGECSGAGGAKP